MKKMIMKLRAGGSKNVLIIGDVMLDEYFFGSVSRISPEAPVPVLKGEQTDWSLGGAANVAANCKHIGFDVSLVGVIGQHDYEGEKILEILSSLKISTEGIVKSTTRPTTCKKRFLANNHQMLRMDSESSHDLAAKEFSDVTAAIDRLLKPESMILISDYAKGMVSQDLMSHILQQAKRLNCTVMVDPKGPRFLKYAGVDYIKPNAKEFGQIVDFFQLPVDRSLEENGRNVCDMLNIKGLIVTMGEKGITYIDRERTIYASAYKREVYDLTGAGDTVFAFLALGLANNFALDECMRLANHAASVAVSHLKTYAVSLEELIDHSMEPAEKIYYDWASLKIELDWLRAEGKRVVFTNGCFDILHPGHIYTLKEAKKHGDILVVGLNTDKSISRLKGPLRPINNLEYRATMMSAIGLVDFVVSFDQDTPQALIEYLRPDSLVKGGDYKKEDIVGYDFIMSYGGSVHVIDYLDGISTTAIIKKLADGRHSAQ